MVVRCTAVRAFNSYVKRSVGIALVAVAFGALAASSPATQPDLRTRALADCGLGKRTHVVKTTGRLVIYTTAHEGAWYPYTPYTRYTACWRRTANLVRLGAAVRGSRLQFQVAGSFVAVNQPSCVVADCGSAGLQVINGRTGSELSTSTTDKTHIRTFKVNDRGAVAWLTGGPQPELRKKDINGEDVVASDSGADPVSVRLTRDRLRWLSSGAVHSLAIGKRKPCGHPRTTTILVNSEARIFETGDGARWACTFARKSWMQLGMPPDDVSPDYAGLEQLQLVGHFLAYVSVFSGRPGYSNAVASRDLSTGRTVHAWSPQEEDRYIGAPVLKDDGAIAWIVSRPDGTAVSWEVYKSDATGEAVLLDSGPDIDSHSLALNASVVSWQHGAEIRSAPLQ